MTELATEKEGLTDFAVREHRSLWLDAWRRLISNRTAMLGLAIVVIFIITAVGAHFFWKYDPALDLDYNAKLLPPSLSKAGETAGIHIFGTDKLGRDIFRRVVHGGWNSLRVGIIAVAISLIIGGVLGLLSGFFESTNLNRGEEFVITGLLGLFCGALPAWIANQPIQAVLFLLLGIASAHYNQFLSKKSGPAQRLFWRNRLFIGRNSRSDGSSTSGLGLWSGRAGHWSIASQTDRG